MILNLNSLNYFLGFGMYINYYALKFMCPFFSLFIHYNYGDRTKWWSKLTITAFSKNSRIENSITKILLTRSFKVLHSYNANTFKVIY